MNNLSEKAQKFLAKKPTLIGVVAGHRYYESIARGEESPLIVLLPDGTINYSDWYELPEVDDVLSGII